MSIFTDHITNQDDFVLRHYNYVYSWEYGVKMLVEKFDLNRPTPFVRKFIPLELVWEYYKAEGSSDVDKLSIWNMPNKDDFVEFTQTFSHPEIRKLIFKGNIYIDRSILHPIYEAFNEHWLQKCKNIKKLTYERI